MELTLSVHLDKVISYSSSNQGETEMTLVQLLNPNAGINCNLATYGLSQIQFYRDADQPGTIEARIYSLVADALPEQRIVMRTVMLTNALLMQIIIIGSEEIRFSVATMCLHYLK